MKKRYLNAFLFLFIVLIVAFTGLFLGQKLMHMEEHSYSDAPEWHAILHKQLSLTEEQEYQFKKNENDFLYKNIQLKNQMHQLNMQLADALKMDKSYSLKVQSTVDEIHHVMGKIQKQTIKHLLGMRPILTNQQNEKLEQIITDALYQSKEHAH